MAGGGLTAWSGWAGVMARWRTGRPTDYRPNTRKSQQLPVARLRLPPLSPPPGRAEAPAQAPPESGRAG